MRTHPYVTNNEFNLFLTNLKRQKSKPENDLPVVNVSGIEADEYCKYAGGRLPTSEELEGQWCALWEWTSTIVDGDREICGPPFGDATINVRAAGRLRYEPDFRDLNLGFRCI